MDFNIAIIGSFSYHYECVGFLCDILLNNHLIENKNIVLNIFYTQDNFGYISYFKQLYPSINTINSNNIEEIKRNNVIIKLTSNDPIIHDENIISILHYFRNKDCSKTFITLSPFVSDITPTIPFNNHLSEYLSNKHLNYIFPLYSGIKAPNHENTILIIGYFVPEYLDADLDSFIRNSQYNFIFIGYERCYNCLNKYPNVNVFINLSTNELVSFISKSKFILARNHKHMSKELFSGTLSLAVSHYKPLILSEYFSNIYNIPAITYNEDFSEITEYLNKMTDEEYEGHKSQLEEFITKQREYNREKISQLI